MSTADSSYSEPKIALKKELGLLSGVSIVVGCIIGSGIFVTPRGVLEYSGGSPAVASFIWVLSGVISLLGALCYAELGTTITTSGGDYAYIKEAFGDLPAFLQLWVNLIIIRPTALAIISLACAHYLLQSIFSDCSPPDVVVQIFAGIFICFLTWINIMKIRWAVVIQNLFTAAKLIAVITIILTGLVVLCMGRTENLHYFMQPTQEITAPGFALALYSGLFAYAGWNFLNLVTEELKDPSVNLPRAIYISITIVTFAYVFTNLSYFVVLLPVEILKSNAVAVTFAGRLYGYFYWIMPVCVALSCFGSLNGLLFTSGRLNFVGARDGQLPIILAMIDPDRLTPTPAILFSSLSSLCMLFLPDVSMLINYISFVQWLSVGASILALIFLRHQKPDLPRPVRLPLFVPITFLLVCCFLLVVPLIAKPNELFIGLGIVLSGVPVYLVFVSWKTKPVSFLKFMGYLTTKGQSLLYVVKQDG